VDLTDGACNKQGKNEKSAHFSRKTKRQHSEELEIDGTLMDVKQIAEKVRNACTWFTIQINAGHC
jgi:hypothetical protein